MINRNQFIEKIKFFSMNQNENDTMVAELLEQNEIVILEQDILEFLSNENEPQI